MIERIARRAFAGALTLSLLAGCASLSPPATVDRPTAARPYHAAIDFTGRLSVRYQGPRNEEALHGSFLWSQTPASTKVSLLSPLGQTIAVIDVTPDGATLTENGQTLRSASDVDDLTAQTLGWPLPVAGLREWLQGFALDAGGRRFVATPGAPEVMTKDGWRIRYANWQDDASSKVQYRPKRIDLARLTEQAGDVSIRIVIDSWQAH
ncbi:lipoprotein insertase outer membrane protein LolB [Noviherbaspirillum sp.]|jgi:outer membrane lipoprotein LolB|uniref:lipoprotein insertase outer membrane protein LolB n=1 Tax=Noviherbaspirillum sp. TaxID=1926288 RepID=UPI0025E770B4|nr:lipoprotein insertase outer membrane protein LolB [Noviherbaspirillum sp.]